MLINFVKITWQNFKKNQKFENIFKKIHKSTSIEVIKAIVWKLDLVSQEKNMRSVIIGTELQVHQNKFKIE